jgi:MFS family permease
MRQYVHVLRHADFRRLWIGSTVSILGDGMTFIALSWLVLNRPGGTAQLGLLGVCYTAPVLLGGLAVGPLLDRFDKRTVLIADSLLRAAAVATIPITAALGGIPEWLPFCVAAVYGLLKMVPLAGFPAAIPALVEERDLDSANALESLSFSVAGVVGPASAGLLIGGIGAANVLAIDSLTFVVFAIATMMVRRPLRQEPRHAGGVSSRSLRVLGRDRVIVVTTLAFMAFNVAEGMLLVTGPWMAKHVWADSAVTLGLLLAALSAGEFLGAALAGAMRQRWSPLLAIGIAQLAGALAFLALLAAPNRLIVGLGFFAVGLFSAPMTVWAQSLRMRRIPPEMHGRAFALLRTMMQATPPLGSALVTPMLVGALFGPAVMVMTAVAAIPAVFMLRDRRLTLPPRSSDLVDAEAARS